MNSRVSALLIDHLLVIVLEHAGNYPLNIRITGTPASREDQIREDEWEISASASLLLILSSAAPFRESLEGRRQARIREMK